MREKLLNITVKLVISRTECICSNVMFIAYRQSLEHPLASQSPGDPVFAVFDVLPDFFFRLLPSNPQIPFSSMHLAAHSFVYQLRGSIVCWTCGKLVSLVNKYWISWWNAWISHLDWIQRSATANTGSPQRTTSGPSAPLGNRIETRFPTSRRSYNSSTPPCSTKPPWNQTSLFLRWIPRLCQGRWDRALIPCGLCRRVIPQTPGRRSNSP